MFSVQCVSPLHRRCTGDYKAQSTLGLRALMHLYHLRQLRKPFGITCAHAPLSVGQRCMCTGD